VKFDIITIFPHAFDSYFNESIIKHARKRGKIKINTVDLRKFSTDKHRKVDDKAYGGGPGMVFKIESLVKVIVSLRPNRMDRIILFSASGRQFDSKMSQDFAKKYNRLILICGHYEGIDARLEKVIKNLKFKIENLSIGPYVLTGGELPAMVVIDSISRHLPGVLGKSKSLEEKRLGVGIPVYTRPEVFKWRGKKYIVPKVLLSGNHKKIESWRKKHGVS